MRIRIGQVKVYPVKGDVAGNFRRLMGVLHELEAARPDVVITPEGFLDGYVVTEEHVTHENVAEYALDLHESAYVSELAGWAASQQAWLIFGCARRAPEGVYNSAVILDRGGQIAGIYDKLHCQTHDHKYVPGQSLPVFNAEFGPFGVMICADRRWPETVRTLALGGARVIFNPTYGEQGDRNLALMRTRSWESEVFIAFTHPGQALVTGPRGEVILNEESQDVDYAVCEIDLAEADAARNGPSGHLRDRRTDVYRLS